MFAALTGQGAVAQVLLERGAKVDASALFYAAGRGFTGITQLLLARGADSSLTDDLHKTALDYAIEADKAPVVGLLKTGFPAERARTGRMHEESSDDPILDNQKHLH